MKIYAFYIAKKVLKSFLSICAFLLIVIILFKIIDLLNDFNLSQSMGLRNIIKFAFYIMPQMFIYISPIALICSCIYVHYSMFSDNELIILQSSGISVWGLIAPFLYITIILTLVSYISVSFLIPNAKTKLFNQRQLVSRSVLPKVITAKTFINVSDKISMYINKKYGDKVEGIIIYDKRDKEDSVIIARNAEVKVYKDSILFKMYNGSRQTVQNNALQMVFFDTLVLNIPFMGYSSGGNISLERYDFISLLKYVPDTEEQRIDKCNEIHKRISWPLVTMVFVFLAMAFLFTSKYSRSWKKRNLFRISICVSLYTFLYFFFRNGINIFTGFSVMLYLNSFIFILFSIWYLVYKNRYLSRAS